MRRLVSGLILVPVLTLVVACERQAAPDAEGPKAAAAAFQHDLSGDVSGYYVPLVPATAGDWTLNRIFVGQPADFAAWEAGGGQGDFAPVRLVVGGIAVRPTAYRVEDDRLRFEGTAEAPGEVVFDGVVDPDALATARRNLGEEGPVVTGTLTVDSQTVRDVRLRWSLGD